MKLSPRTLVSSFLTLLILCGGAAWLWQNHHDLTAARQARETLHATRLELERESGAPATNPRQDASRPSPRETQTQQARRIARDLLAASAAIAARQAQGQEIDRELADRRLQWQTQADLLDTDGLKAFVTEIQLSGDLNDPAVLRMISNALLMLADRNPEAALTFLDRPDSGLTRRIIETAATKALQWWALRSPEKAGTWLDEKLTAEPGFLSPGGRQALISSLAAADAGVALALMKDHTSSVEMTSALLTFTWDSSSEAQEKAASIAKDYFHSLPEGQARDQAARAFYQHFADTVDVGEFQQVSTRLEQERLSPPEVAGLLNGLSSRGMGDNQSQWMDWITAQAPARELGDDFSAAMTNWAKNNPVDAVTWALQSPDEDARRIGLESVAGATGSMDLQDAERTALMFPEGTARTGILQQTYDRWPAADPDGKAAFAVRHGLK